MNKQWIIMGHYEDIGIVPIIELEEGLTRPEAENQFYSFCYHPTEAEKLMIGDATALWLKEIEKEKQLV